MERLVDGDEGLLALDGIGPKALAEVKSRIEAVAPAEPEEPPVEEPAEAGALVENLVTEHERVVDQSRLDGLTGVLSRSAFLNEATKALSRASRHAIPFVVLFCDVDGFKKTNDTHGHHFGDFVLREVCARMRKRRSGLHTHLNNLNGG